MTTTRECASGARCSATSTSTRAIERTTEFTADFQDLITRYAWGEIWARPGLDRRTRSCVTLTALVALGREHELAMHVRAALRNGLTRGRARRGAAAVRRLLRRAGGQRRVRDRPAVMPLGSERRAPRHDAPARASPSRGPIRPRNALHRRRPGPGGPVRARARSLMRTQVAIVGAGPAGLTLGPAAPPRGDRLRRPREPQPRIRRGAHPRRRARAGRRRSAHRGRRGRAGWRARGSCTKDSSCSSRASGTGIDLTTAHRARRSPSTGRPRS